MTSVLMNNNVVVSCYFRSPAKQSVLKSSKPLFSGTSSKLKLSEIVRELEQQQSWIFVLDLHFFSVGSTTHFKERFIFPPRRCKQQEAALQTKGTFANTWIKRTTKSSVLLFMLMCNLWWTIASISRKEIYEFRAIIFGKKQIF